MEKNNNTLVTIKIDTGHRSFSSYEDLLDWIIGEEKVFGWISKLHVNELHGLTEIYKKFYQSARQISSSLQNPNYEQSDAYKRLESEVTSFFNHHNGMSSESAKGKFILRQHEKHGPSSAGWTLQALTTKSLNSFHSISAPNDIEGIQGIARAVQFELGSSDAVHANQESLEAMKARYESSFVKMLEEAAELNVSNTEKSANWETILENAQERAITSEAERTQAFDEHISNCVVEKANIEKIYNESLKLKAPVQYWQTKASSHNTTLGISGAIAIALASLFVLVVYAIRNEAQESETVLVTLADVQLLDIVFILSLSTVLIWLVRLFAKISIANLHLRDDALERVTMMNAYLALSKDSDGGLTPADMEVVLGALFRPASSGLIKDDGVNSPIEVINKMFNR